MEQTPKWMVKSVVEGEADETRGDWRIAFCHLASPSGTEVDGSMMIDHIAASVCGIMGMSFVGMQVRSEVGARRKHKALSSRLDSCEIAE